MTNPTDSNALARRQRQHQTQVGRIRRLLTAIADGIPTATRNAWHWHHGRYIHATDPDPSSSGQAIMDPDDPATWPPPDHHDPTGETAAGGLDHTSRLHDRIHSELRALESQAEFVADLVAEATATRAERCMNRYCGQLVSGGRSDRLRPSKLVEEWRICQKCRTHEDRFGTIWGSPGTDVEEPAS